MMERELREYEKKVVKEMMSAKFFSWKRLWKTIELAGICDMLNH